MRRWPSTSTVPVARKLEQLGADYLAVSCYEEAAELRAAGIRTRILILAPSPAFLAPDIARLGVEQAVGDIDCARAQGEVVRDHVVAEWHRVRRGR